MLACGCPSGISVTSVGNVLPVIKSINASGITALIYNCSCRQDYKITFEYPDAVSTRFAYGTAFYIDRILLISVLTEITAITIMRIAGGHHDSAARPEHPDFADSRHGEIHRKYRAVL